MKEENQDQVVRAGVAAAAGGVLGALIGGPMGAAAGAAAGVWIAGQLREPEREHQKIGALVSEKSSIFLLLAFRSSAIENISSIPIDKPLDEDSCKKLFQHSKYMWKGSIQSFNANNFVDLIKGKNIREGSLNDEYAFHLIALEVDKEIAGLDKEADPLGRLDAFIRLADRAKIIGVSPPLPSTSFEHKGFYKLV
jgi:hypothetical protein